MEKEEIFKEIIGEDFLVSLKDNSSASKTIIQKSATWQLLSRRFFLNIFLYKTGGLNRGQTHWLNRRFWPVCRPPEPELELEPEPEPEPEPPVFKPTV